MNPGPCRPCRLSGQSSRLQGARDPHTLPGDLSLTNQEIRIPPPISPLPSATLTSSDMKGALPDGKFGVVLQLSLYLSPGQLCAKEKGANPGGRQLCHPAWVTWEGIITSRTMVAPMTTTDFPQTLSWSLHSRCVISAHLPWEAGDTV